MQVSMIISTHNRANLLTDCLGSIGRMIVPEDCHLELIVVNNASTDETRSVVEEFSRDCKNLSVTMLFENRLGKTYALNKAIENAGGEVLVFADDDHIISEGYLEAVCTAVKKNHGCSLFCGRIIPDWDGTEPEWIHDNSAYPIRPFPIPHFDLGDVAMEVKNESGMFVPGAGNLVIRKSVFQKSGLFSEHLGPKGHNLSGGEDIEFVKRALKCRERLLYIPEIVQFHQIDQSKLKLSYLVKKAYFRSLAAYQFSETKTNHQNHHIPKYLFGQVFIRLIKALFAVKKDARRYYWVRLSATLGEIQGRRRAVII